MAQYNRGQQLDAVITEAAKTGNIEEALAQHRVDLSPEERTALLSLTTDELQQLTRLKEKLGPLGRAVADNNGGVF